MSSVTHELMPPPDEKSCVVIVKDNLKAANNKYSLALQPSSSCKNLHMKISKKFHYVVGTFDLVLTKSNVILQTTQCTIADRNEGSLTAAGFSINNKNYVEIKERPGVAVEMLRPSISEKDETITSMPPQPPPLLPENQIVGKATSHRRMAISTDKEDEKTPTVNLSNCATETASTKALKHVGLVNQAMTCYLNSLLQTLFMTPEFRNALYKWECDSPDDAASSIPYQLQHVFLLLQTSEKSVETTGLTRSFGWDSSEAWQQHDVQELCRVMFDALEKKFEGTDQADLIKRLYEGTMKDYVQCCECAHESARDDTFLDIPITIRPFGSTKTFKSVTEGLNAFVEPETLAESNQYYCEKCDKKCDAKKGLKFTKFPYLLTLQLKRFDFDYSTMNRVKLNDRMSFPQILNLNSFVENEEAELDEDLTNEDEVKDIRRLMIPDDVDEDSSSRDSGHDFEHGSSLTNSESRDGFQNNRRNSSEEEEERSSVDEGIDIEPQVASSHKRKKSNPTWWMNDEAEEKDRYLQEGPYVYELFSIMVHSGSAVGGHYYAYIKSFENNQWYSFNDQIVSPITYLDIEKTYGEPSYVKNPSYYSSYSSSTNAYMLMYRQISDSKNAKFTPTNQLPAHILKLLEHEKEVERYRRMKEEHEKNMCSIRIYCRHPSLKKHSVPPLVDETFEFHKDTMLADAVKKVHSIFKLDSKVVPAERCRLVKYDSINDVMDRSYDLGTEDAQYSLSALLGGPRTTYLYDLLLETREVNETFQRYEKGGIAVKVFVVDHQKKCFHEPFVVRAVESQTVEQLKIAISARIGCQAERILIAYEKYNGDCQLLQSLQHTLKDSGFFKTAKIFIDVMTSQEFARVCNENPDFKLEETSLWSVMDRIANVIIINIALPPEVPQQPRPASISNFSKADLEKPDAENPSSTSSSDEGVGSLGAGSGNGESSSPLGVDVDAQCSFTLVQGSEPRANISVADLTPDEVKDFWQIPEMDDDDDLPPLIKDDGRYSDERRRKNSCEENFMRTHLVADLHGKLQQRLEDFVSGPSPSSSLRCEDSQSSHSGQNSLITDMDFEGDGSKYTETPEDFAADSNVHQDAAPTEAVAGHETTLPRNEQRDRDNNLAKTETASRSFRPVLKRSFPGRVVSCNTTAITEPLSDYNKALQYVDNSSPSDGNGTFSKTKNVFINAAGTGDPSDCMVEPDKSHAQCKRSIVTCEPSNTDVLATSERLRVCYSHHGNSNAVVSFCTSTTAVCTSCNAMPITSRSEKHDNVKAEALPLSSSNAGSSDSRENTHRKTVTTAKCNIQDDDLASKVGHTELKSPQSNKTTVVADDKRERAISASSLASDGFGFSTDIIQQHDYFNVVASSKSKSTHTSPNGEVRSCEVISVEIDKRMTLLCLKRRLAHVIEVPTRRFCLYRQYNVGQEMEISSPTDDFKMVTNGANFVIRLGRALCKDEFRCKLFQLALCEDEDDTSKHFMNWVVRRGASITETRKLLASDIAEQCGIYCEPDRIRLRKKTWSSPGQIFLPDDVFGNDISLYGPLEFFVEFLQQPEPKTRRGDLLLLCRRWFPEELRFSDFHEVILREKPGSVSYLGYSLEHVQRTISEVSGIPEENILVSKGRGMFPYRTSVLTADKELDWLPTKDHFGSLHLSEDGSVIIYKDRSELLKECTIEEKAQIKKREQKSEETPSQSGVSTPSATNISHPTRPTYRREKALKIYTADTNPSRNKATTTDL